MAKRSIIILLILILPFKSSLYSMDNFDPDLAKDLIRLSTSYTFDELYNTKSQIVPEENELFYRSYIINNEKDIIPSLPISFNDTTYYVKESIVQYFQNPLKLKLTSMARDISYFFFGDFLSYVMHQSSRSIIIKISQDLGSVKMPRYLRDINYAMFDQQIDIPSVNYPFIDGQNIVIENKGVKTMYCAQNFDQAVLNRISNSNSKLYQHKPYNYYISILLAYFPDLYETLENKFLPEFL